MDVEKEISEIKEEIGRLKKSHQFLLKRAETVLKADGELLAIVKKLEATMTTLTDL